MDDNRKTKEQLIQELEDLRRRIAEFEKSETERKHAEEALLEREEHYRTLFNDSLDGICLADAETGIIIDCNKALAALVCRERAELIGRPQLILHPPQDDKAAVSPTFKQHLTDKQWQIIETQVVTRTGDFREVEIKANSLYLQGRKLLQGIFHDITERKEAESNLRESEERYRTAIEHSHDGVALVREGRHVYVNQKFLEIFGYDINEEVIGKPHFITVHPDDLEMVAERNRKRERGESVPLRYEFKGIRKDGTPIYIEISATRVTFQREATTLAYFRNVTERKELEEKLRTMSIIDDLTGLYNRRGFFTLAQQQMKVTERTKKEMLLFFADLDKMKQINDILGHQEGDKALVEIATILKEVFRESDIIGRMGGDEFVILAIDTTNGTREVLMKRLHNYLDDYNRPEGRSYTLSLSIGIVPYDPKKPFSLDELMAQADTLMYEEKRNKQQ